MLTTAQLGRAHLERVRTNHDTYKAILQQCYAAIRASDARRLCFVRFAVPRAVAGRPPYTLSHATGYVSAKLAKGGFGVGLVPPHAHLLHVQWGALGRP